MMNIIRHEKTPANFSFTEVDQSVNQLGLEYALLTKTIFVN